MKRRGRKTESGIKEMRVDIAKQVAVIASATKVHAERKGNWVAGKVEQAMHNVEKGVDTLEGVVDKKLAE